MNSIQIRARDGSIIAASFKASRVRLEMWFKVQMLILNMHKLHAWALLLAP